MNENKIPVKVDADTYMFNTYNRFPVALVRGEGCRVWDENGKEYLDFVSGIAVCSLGHCSPVVTRALEEQSRKLVHVSNLYYTEPQTELAKLLVLNSFADRVFFCNSGAEANEAAIKLARKYSYDKSGPGRHTIISMLRSFHGRTMATLTATGQEKVKAGYDPLLNGFKFVPFNDIQSLEETIDGSVCAVMLEPIQGEGGVILPEPEYLKKVRQLCDDRGVLLIFDEVQVGMGRTGKLFAHEHFGVTPDIMTLAKALGNGLPIGAMMAKEALSASFGPGSHASTFGGTPLITAVSRSVLIHMLEGGVIDHCAQTGKYFKERLESMATSYNCIKKIRGLGLIIGMELNCPVAPVILSCIDAGFLVASAGEYVLRFIPPLIIGKDDIDRLIETLVGVFDKIQ